MQGMYGFHNQKQQGTFIFWTQQTRLVVESMPQMHSAMYDGSIDKRKLGFWICTRSITQLRKISGFLYCGVQLRKQCKTCMEECTNTAQVVTNQPQHGQLHACLQKHQGRESNFIHVQCQYAYTQVSMYRCFCAGRCTQTYLGAVSTLSYIEARKYFNTNKRNAQTYAHVGTWTHPRSCTYTLT